jgi:hypothetical protein
MSSQITRRSFVKGAVLGSAGAALGMTRAANAAQPVESPAAPPVADPLPRGTIGKLELSRLLLGGNLLTHYTHSRDLRYVYTLAKHYNTREKIFETMAMAEAQGINALVIHTADGVMDMLKEYRSKRGGKIKWIICPTAPIAPGLEEYRRQVAQIVDDGVDAVYLWGVRSDALVGQGKVDLIAEAVEIARSKGVPSGVGAHRLAVVEACEQSKINPDFYLKTLHHHSYATAPKAGEAQDDTKELPGYWCGKPRETIELMQKVNKPWIAFKVMAAGAIPPQNGFKYAVRGGADFVLAGMFDFEIAEDVRMMKEILASTTRRDRPWIG